MKNIFVFDVMLTPKLITVVYWLLLFATVASGLNVIIGNPDQGILNRLGMGLFIIVGGGVAARIWCELLIVLFKIHENIRKLADR